jgi:hypothetical protein
MIEFVGANSANATTVTIPTHKIGDLIIIFAFRDGSTTNPTIGSGFTTLTNTLDGTSCSVSVGYRIATATNTTSGTWTNATDLICLVYRGQLNTGTPLGTFTGTAGTAASVTYGAVTLVNKGGSWVIAFAGHRSINTSLETPPANMSLVIDQLDATMESAAFHQNCPHINWPSTDVAVGGTASGWITFVIEIFAQGFVLNNYKFAKANSSSGISVTEKIK